MAMARSSLIAFHRVLIGTGIIFCVGFAIWIWTAGHPVLAVVFIVLALALSYYLKNLSRFLDYTEKG
jgi:hypothetical protein